jgi:hypothetical protein
MTRRKNPLAAYDIADLRAHGVAAGLSDYDVDALLAELNEYVDFKNGPQQAWAVKHLTDLARRSLDVQSWTTPEEMKARMAVARVVLGVVSRLAFDLQPKVK